MPENIDRDAPMRSDVRLLGNMLGRVLREQGSERLFETEETLRHAARQRRDDGDDRALVAAVEALPPALTYDVLRAFTVYFQLVNIAEQHHRIRRNRLRAIENPPRPFSLDDCAAHLRAAGVDVEAVRRVLAGLWIRSVFTAHPTESRRRTVMAKLHRMADLLERLDRRDVAPERHEELEAALHEEVISLWQSDDVRETRPTVIDEVHQGLYYVENVLFDVVPRVVTDFARSLSRAYEGPIDVPDFFTLGSWIGGDRDGNPFVTPDVTREALRVIQILPTRLYLERVNALFGQLSQSTRRVTMPSALLASLDVDRGEFGPQVAAQVEARSRHEPLRQKLNFVARRLQLRLAWLEGDPFGTPRPPLAYGDAEALRADLEGIEQALLACGAAPVAHGALGRLLRQVRAFGLHLVVLDVREHRDKHRAALAAIYASLGRPGYGDLSDDERAAWLTEEMANPRLLLNPRLPLSDEVMKVPNTYKVLAEARQTLGPQGLGTCIISMLGCAADVLEVLVFLKEAGLQGAHDIAPLFETLEALENAPAVIDTLLSNPVYRAHVRARGDLQEVLLGYSDSGKDVGFLEAQLRC